MGQIYIVNSFSYGCDYMEFRKEAAHFVIRLEKGEKIMETLNLFLSERQIKGGFFQGIGGVSDAEIGYFDLEKRQYLWKVLKSPMEVVSFMGSISETGIHAHICLADSNFILHGGHLKEATVSLTLEVFLTEMKKIRKKDDPQTGLKLMEL
jgi:uncharacterized protein